MTAHFVKVLEKDGKRFAYYEPYSNNINLRDKLTLGIDGAEVESVWLFKTKKEATETAEYWDKNWEREDKILKLYADVAF